MSPFTMESQKGTKHPHDAAHILHPFLPPYGWAPHSDILVMRPLLKPKKEM